MANQLSANPFSLDTVGASALLTGKVKIEQISWYGYTNISDVVELQDSSGNVIWFAAGSSDLTTLKSAHIGWVKGLLLPVLTTGGVANLASGKLLVYFR